MFTAADDAAAGIPVVHEPYPDGEEGIQKSIFTICKKVREGAHTAVMKSFAGNMMKEAGFPQTIREQGQVVLDNIRSRAMYTPDALGSEQIQSAAVTWCVPGAPVCIPIYDCDDGVTAVATVMAALGHEVEIVRQYFGAGHQQHVLLEVRDEDGLWCPLDPSSKTMPAGAKAPAERETRHSPFDDAPPGAKFVGIGKLKDAALPVLVRKGNQWHRIGMGVSIEQAVGVGDACCASCANGGECEGKNGDGVSGIYCMHKNDEAAMGVGEVEAKWVPIGQNVEALRRGMVRPKPKRGTGQLPGDLAAEVKDLVIQQTDQAKAQIITETKGSVWTAGLVGGVVGGVVGFGIGMWLAKRR